MNDSIAKRFGGWLWISVVLSTFVACSGAAETGDSKDNVTPSVNADGSRTLTRTDGADSVESADGIPGQGLTEKARNCAYIEWCDAPARNVGTICRMSRSCTPQQGYDECDRDAVSVCGGYVYPAWNLYPGQRP